MNELALFAGAGGGILGSKLLGWRTVCAVEIEPYARRVLMARQDDGCLEPFPIWDDVRTFEGRQWRGLVDVISGGFPCQDISAAGKGAGIAGARSGLWSEFARIIREVEPRFVLVENSPMLTSRGLGRVLGDLASMGYDASWGVLGADDAGAPHRRDRIWIVANSNTNSFRELQPQRREPSEWGWSGNVCEEMADAELPRLERQRNQSRDSEIAEPRNHGVSLSDTSLEIIQRRTDGLGWRQSCTSDDPSRPRSAGCEGSNWWLTEPDVGRVAHGVASRVDRLRGLGNGQVPAVVRLAWETLMNMNQPTRSAEESNVQR